MTKKTTVDPDPKSTPEARGKRLKTVRLMAGLTRIKLEEKYGISASTTQSWEAAKAGGLTERGVKRIIPILQEEGVFCSEDWLFYGVGKPPHPTTVSISQVQEGIANYQSGAEDKIIIQELLTYRTLNNNVIDFIIPDDGMEPQYEIGDYVAGSRRRGDDIETLINQACIVETIDNEVMLRYVKRGALPGRYTLICTNIDTSITKPTLYDQRLISAAPVNWHRRHDPEK